MNLPFTKEQFMEVFSMYHEATWPAIVIAYLLAALVIFLLYKKSIYTNKIIPAILAFFWAWTGLVYHIYFFATINKAALFFGTLFVLEAGCFLYCAFRKELITRLKRIFILI